MVDNAGTADNQANAELVSDADSVPCYWFADGIERTYWYVDQLSERDNQSVSIGKSRHNTEVSFTQSGLCWSVHLATATI